LVERLRWAGAEGATRMHAVLERMVCEPACFDSPAFGKLPEP
jgi:hypothetical protein